MLKDYTKIPIATRYWLRLTGISKQENNPHWNNSIIVEVRRWSADYS